MNISSDQGIERSLPIVEFVVNYFRISWRDVS